ncbi:MAG: peptidoglycan-binding protein [Nitriliruptorales bacterium]|nr:peptidoglycan-binding protein [Nitriliruptorales bacterium]
MTQRDLMRLSAAEMEAEVGTPLPAKEVISLLDLNVDIDVALDLAAPIDLAVAANANIAAPIDAAVAANVLSFSSKASAMADQGVMLDQYLSGEAIADAPQDALIDQSNDIIDDGGAADTTDGATDGTADAGAVDSATGAVDNAVDGTNTVQDTATGITTGSLDGDLLNVNVKVDLDADLVAPVAGAVAANANVAAPIDAGAAANVGSFDSEAIAVADQDAILTQTLDDVTAHATAAQDADVTQ